MKKLIPWHVKYPNMFLEEGRQQASRVATFYIIFRFYLSTNYTVVSLIKSELPYPFWYPFNTSPTSSYANFLVASILIHYVPL